ncbi:AAA family ATPase [Streptomyces sp. 71268]|uniref:ArsA family ATPase n=1 Tax=Streptomyces sp. 71268 TaxID=3002640 RepID=UPI0023F7EDE0|nr:ArsA-related P-loop ATPase [Streptomyces sp. 71268]WEV26793.1 AAA family ATPase [Streptomyces sp. 71268]
MTMDTAPRLEADAVLDDPRTRIVVCCGSGGVGKTTTAAALGVRAAERGRKVVVLTIDPARRLAQSMGIDSLDNVPRQVKGIDDTAGGELHAMMLDMKRTFDEFVEAHADAERAAAILRNPFYQSLSAGFAGTQEYMAMEKLGQLRARDEWDLIIVDTPPSRSALDFLDAPKRLGSFLDGKFIKVLMAPAKVGGRAGMKFLNVGMSMMTGTVSKLLGGQLLRDVQTFAAAMDTMFGGFRTRADATYQLLQAPGTAFLVVAAPERDALREAAYFVERLAAERMPLAGLVLNRVHGSGAAQLSAERALAVAESLRAADEEPVEETAPVNSKENLPVGGIVDRPAGQGEGSSSSPTTRKPHDTAEHAAPTGALAHDEGPHATTTPQTPASAPATGSDDPAAATDIEATTPPETSAEVTAAATEPAATTPATDGDPDRANAEQLAAGLLLLHAERMSLLAREQRTRDRFTALHPEVPVAEVAALPGDVHDLVGLRAVGERLAAQRS